MSLRCARPSRSPCAPPSSPAWLRACAALGLLAAAALAAGCGDDVKAGLVVSISSDMAVPKDLDAVGVEVRRGGKVESFRLHPLDAGRRTLPIVLSVAPGRDDAPVELRIGAWKDRALRVVREAATVVPRNRRAHLAIQINWLCDGQVAPGATQDDAARVRSSCGDGLTCLQGECRSRDVDPLTLPTWDPAQAPTPDEARRRGDCLDVSTCLGRGGMNVTPDSAACTIRRPAAAVGLNVAMTLPPGSAGVCDGRSCFIPIDGFRLDGGWQEQGDRVILPPAVCRHLADGRITGLVVSASCPTKTVSVPVCPVSPPPASGRDAGAAVGPDGGASPARDASSDAALSAPGLDAAPDRGRDAAGPRPDGPPRLDASRADARPLPVDASADRAPGPDTRPVACADRKVCQAGDACCAPGCHANNDGDCQPVCGNGVVERDELCDGNCPTSCPAAGCQLKSLEGGGTCRARCVNAALQTMCRSQDQCCPSGCTNLTDGDCACQPKAETCNGQDDDCDGQVDEGVQKTFYRDRDQDGFGDGKSPAQACAAPAGHVADGTDCDDASASVKPGGAEACNGKDDDCDGQIDEGVKATFYRDADGDGHGAAATSTAACSAPAGWVAAATDCDDGNAAVSPSAVEACNHVDDNCSGAVDEGCRSSQAVAVGSFAPLTAAHPLCTQATSYSNSCYAASSRHCQSSYGAFTVSGYGAADVNGADPTIVCVNGNLAVLQTKTFAELAAHHGGCASDLDVLSAACSSAVHRACAAQGHVSGFGPVEHELGVAQIVCVRRGVVTSAPVATLQAYHPGCNDVAQASSAACLAAIHRYCRTGGWEAGFGAVEVDATSLHFTCLPPF